MKPFTTRTGIFWALMFGFIALPPAQADTTMVSGIMIGQTWTKSGSPYVLTGDLTVHSLNIQPGVKVIGGSARGNFRITVTNTLTAVGTPQDSVVFGNAGGQAWKGIVFANTQVNSVLRYCVVKETWRTASGEIGGGAVIENTSPIFENTSFVNNIAYQGGGAYVNGGSPRFKNCVFRGNEAYNAFYSYGAAVFVSTGTPVFENCLFTGNLSGYWPGPDPEFGTIYYVGNAATDTLRILNCTVAGNQSYGLTRYPFVGGNYLGVAIVRNSIFYDNLTAEMFGNLLDVRYSAVKGGWPGTGNVGAQPYFVDSAFHLHPQISTLIDAGDSGAGNGDGCLPPGLGAARNDMGAYGGPGNCDWGLEPPQISAPSQDQILRDSTVNFSWNPVSGMNRYILRVYEATASGALNPDSLPPVFEDTAITSTTRTVGSLRHGKTYYARVAASGDSDQTPFSPPRRFRVDLSVIAAPQLAAPSDGATDMPTTVVLDWNGAALATAYDVDVSTDTGFLALERSLRDLPSDSSRIQGLALFTGYYWRVRGKNPYGIGPWSPRRGFTVGALDTAGTRWVSLFREDFEPYPTGILGNVSNGKWTRLQSSRAGNVATAWSHGGQKNLEIYSFTTSTEADFARFPLAYRPEKLSLEFWYTIDAFFVYQDYAEVGLGNSSGPTQLTARAGVAGSGRNLLFGQAGGSTQTVFAGLNEGPLHNYVRIEWDFTQGKARFYVGSDRGAPLASTVDFNPDSLAVNSIYALGGLNPTHIDDIVINATEAAVPVAMPPRNKLPSVDLTVQGGRIRYSLPGPRPVDIRVFDLQGKERSRLVQATQSAGLHQANLPSHLAPGLYILSFRAGEFRREQRFHWTP